jgi:hypothetical protein
MKFGVAFFLGILVGIAPAGGETSFLFEFPGERKDVGSWSVIVQDQAAVMVMSGGTRLRKYPDTLDVSVGEAFLQMTCNAGVIIAVAVLPEGELLVSGAHEGRFGWYMFWFDDELIGRQEVAVSDVVLEGPNLVVPVFSARQADMASIGSLLDADSIAVRAAPVNIMNGMVTASFSLSETRDSFAYLATACGWD